ncbi:Fe-S protein assembly co-chaperone HscB [Noviherbaspirillum sedimenti]|uniref:Co-chaperone protein HscB homolog n=1 Tax=Noviherbaspirillum sedimenti TaxID=2320865 RepID=A0A3A3G153_9BURK|nr:Fe-S protein assembly co-chaperone HscB [Noviherbaspirillum sedimenti]RJG00192.1 Fe-S protein assembly co-chaperone HscB [Noviherbaspirillum sedimenti]
MKTHFDLFQLPQRFEIDLAALDRAYHEVQNQAHPDRFASASSAEKRVAMQWATRANEAYQTLKNPLARAKYLCELNGVDLQVESNTAMPPAFLMQQMEWREALEDAHAAKDIGALESLEGELLAARKAEVAGLAAQLDTGDFHAAALGVRRMMFVEKFEDEVARVFDLVSD